MASEEDKKMAENWKDDADGILIFVRHYLLSMDHASLYTFNRVIDRSILRCCRIIDLGIHSGPPAEPAGYI